jgi:hypothetical protein
MPKLVCFSPDPWDMKCTFKHCNGYSQCFEQDLMTPTRKDKQDGTPLNLSKLNFMEEVSQLDTTFLIIKIGNSVLSLENLLELRLPIWQFLLLVCRSIYCVESILQTSSFPSIESTSPALQTLMVFEDLLLSNILLSIL